MSVTIYNNMSLTGRAQKRLITFPYFSRSDSGSTKYLAFLWWLLGSCVPGKDGKWVCSKGPHFTLSTIDLDEIEQHPRTYAFSIEGHILCVQFSKDWDFDPATLYRLDYVDEFVLYLAALDEGDAASVPSI